MKGGGRVLAEFSWGVLLKGKIEKKKMLLIIENVFTRKLDPQHYF